MLLAVGVSIWLISDKMGLGLVELGVLSVVVFSSVLLGRQTTLFEAVPFGAFLAIVMTGLDQR